MATRPHPRPPSATGCQSIRSPGSAWSTRTSTPNRALGGRRTMRLATEGATKHRATVLSQVPQITPFSANAGSAFAAMRVRPINTAQILARMSSPFRAIYARIASLDQPAWPVVLRCARVPRRSAQLDKVTRYVGSVATWPSPLYPRLHPRLTRRRTRRGPAPRKRAHPIHPAAPAPDRAPAGRPARLPQASR